jgi:hypothetical protein
MSQSQHLEPVPAVGCSPSLPAANVDIQQAKEFNEPTSRCGNEPLVCCLDGASCSCVAFSETQQAAAAASDAVSHSGSNFANCGSGAGFADVCAEEGARSSCARSSCGGLKNSVDVLSPIAAQKPCGRKGIERKNFSKQVVDALQSWFYKNISHPYACPCDQHAAQHRPPPSYISAISCYPKLHFLLFDNFSLIQHLPSYPNEKQKDELSNRLGISHSQVCIPHHHCWRATSLPREMVE